MTKTKILIDSNIWHIGFTISKEPAYQELCKEANSFIKKQLEGEDIVICISTYQMGEILELFRKYKLDPLESKETLDSFFTEKFIIGELTSSVVKEAYELSNKSDIHIYDYLVVLPVKDIVDKIYSADEHLKHEDFTSICEVINPLKPWILIEGRKPQRK